MVVILRDFNINITFDEVVGATFYTFWINGRAQNSTSPTFDFDSLNSGQTYDFTVSATKLTTYGAFESKRVFLTNSTSKCYHKKIS